MASRRLETCLDALPRRRRRRRLEYGDHSQGVATVQRQFDVTVHDADDRADVVRCRIIV